MSVSLSQRYRGRIAPTPTGYLHLGHVATFSKAMQRAQSHCGDLIYREEDLDAQRCKDTFRQAAIKDLRGWGLDWNEGLAASGRYYPYQQSKNLSYFKSTLLRLFEKGVVYPCNASRKLIRELASKSYADDIIYPLNLRPKTLPSKFPENAFQLNWRFRTPDNDQVTFVDGHEGQVDFRAQLHFGDFLVWRKLGVPSYELAVVADDHRMKITEVVRGADLLLSTARQILIYQALDWEPPQWYHCPLVVDRSNNRLAKTVKSLSIRTLIEKGIHSVYEFDKIQDLALTY